MTETIESTRATPVEPTRSARSVLRPVGTATIDRGFWVGRQDANGSDAITSGLAQLESFGNLDNLRIAGGSKRGDAIGPVFADSDVYKWLEAVAWEYRRSPSEGLLTMQRDVTGIVAAAQEDDGYLDSTIQIREGRAGRYRDLPWSHEHYCAGHLIQAAVAQRRCTGDAALLDVAVRLADHLVATFGPGLTEDIDGHPVIETALVELYRETGTAEYLELASWFVDARGHGLIEKHGKEPTYFSDRVPVRDATTLEGHAVRAVYLAAGATDVAIEGGDDELLAALIRQFDDTLATKTYLTGGLGSRWEGEAFGDPFELPPDRAYAETCAAIGGIQWAWRMLLATGQPRYADTLERMLYNGFLAGVSLTGTEYFYVNPLQLRAGSHPDENRSPAHGRRGWFECACCPPNIMRMLASLDAYLATHDDSGVQLHQYASGTVSANGARLRVETDYPWDGIVRIFVEDTPSTPWTLSLRIPGWADGATIAIGPDASGPDAIGSGGTGAEPAAVASAGAYSRLERIWNAGDVVELTLPLVVREVDADPRIDSIRGCTALERGPLVYTVEQADNTAPVDDIRFEPGSPVTAESSDGLLGRITTLTAKAKTVVDADLADWPYFPGAGRTTSAGDVDVTLIPYYAWANRDIGAMRVWLPTP